MSFHLTVASSMKHPSASAAQSEPLSETPTVCAGAAAAAKLGSLSLPAFTRYAAVSRPMMRRPTGVKSGARKPTPFFWDVKSFATNCLIVLMDAMPAAGIADYKNKKVSWPGRVLSTPKVPCDRWQNIYIREYRLKSGLACSRRTPMPSAPAPDGGRDGYLLGYLLVYLLGYLFARSGFLEHVQRESASADLAGHRVPLVAGVTMLHHPTTVGHCYGAIRAACCTLVERFLHQEPLAAHRTQYSRCPGAPSGRGPPQHLHFATRFHARCSLRWAIGWIVSISQSSAREGRFFSLHFLCIFIHALPKATEASIYEYGKSSSFPQ